MCPYEASTAVWSAVVPRSSGKRHARSVSLDDTRLFNCSKYSKLVDSGTGSFSSAHKKADSLSSANIQQRSQDQENGSSQLHKTPTDHVFQVTVITSHFLTPCQMQCKLYFWGGKFSFFLLFFVSDATCYKKELRQKQEEY